MKLPIRLLSLSLPLPLLLAPPLHPDSSRPAAAPTIAPAHTGHAVALARQEQEAAAEARLRIRDGALLVTVLAADGTELDFGLGTASPPTVLSESTVARFGEAPELTVGGLPVGVEGHETWPDDRLGPSVAGVIGAAMLRDYDVLVDVPGGRLVLREVGPPAPWEGVALSEPVPVQVLHGSVISLSTGVGGSQIFTLLDLASSATVFSPPTAARLGLEPEGEVTVGIGATELTTPYEQQDLPVFRAFDPEGNGFIILGASIAADCPLALSWAHREIWTCVR